MIGLAWSISFILWAPAILFWQYIVGERTVQPDECYIQFLSEPIITFCTAIAAFYLPVTIMTFLFWKIYQETEKRAKDVQGLKGSGSGTGSSPAQSSSGASGSQKSSSAMLRQTSSQSCSSYELNQQDSDKNNRDNEAPPGGTGGSGRWGRLCLQFSSLLPGQRAAKTSGTVTPTAGGADQSSCDSLNNNDAGGGGGSEEEGEGADSMRPPTGREQLYYLLARYCIQIWVKGPFGN